MLVQQVIVAMNNQRSKLGNIPCEFEGVKFDSKWELEVYKVITSIIPPNYVSIHQKVLIKPTTKNYRARYWRCDFAIRGNEGELFLLIEAKGIPTRDWLRQLQLIDATEPSLIDKIRIVQTESTKIDECFTSITIIQLHRELEKLKELINNV